MDLIRAARLLVDRPTKQRFVLAAAGSVLLALVEAVGVGLVYSFIQTLNDPTSVRRVRVFTFFYDLLGGTDTRTFLPVLGVVIFGIFLVRCAFAVAFTWWQLGFAVASESRLGARMLQVYLDAPYAVHLSRNSAELIRNVQAATQVFFANVVLAWLGLITECAVMVCVVGVLFLQEPGVAAATAAFGLVVAVLYQRAVHRPTVRVGIENHRFAMESQQHLHQALGGVKDLKVLGKTEYFTSVYGEVRHGWSAVRRRQAFLAILPRYYLEAAMMVSVMCLTVFLLRTRTGTDTLAVLGLFVTAGYRLLSSLNRILLNLSQIKVGREPTIDLYNDLLALGPYLQASGRVERLEFRQGIELEDVTFRYEGAGTDVIDRVSMVVRRGESVGLVGASGAGKTTLVDILLGLLEPTQGRVLIDGQDQRDVLGSWKEIIGYVPQAIYLTDDTVRHNVAFGQRESEIDDLQVMESLRLAQLEDFVAALPSGYDTEIGEQGVRLSGGQRQRIGIARALYRRPEVLILDEATSSLDSETESRIGATVDGLKGNMTMLIIAHRLSTVRACDRLIYMRDGAVAGEGSFDDLAARHAGFAELVRLSQLTTSLPNV